MTTPSPETIERFWRNARAAVPGLPEQPPAADRVWGFGATPAHADGLLDLVLAGVKTGTSGALWDYEAASEQITSAGDLDIILDGAGVPRAVIQTTAVDIVPFEEVTAEHAHAEGEDDRSLASWRDIHERFFTEHARHGRGFDPRMPVVCERFRLVYPA